MVVGVELDAGIRVSDDAFDLGLVDLGHSVGDLFGRGFDTQFLDDLVDECDHGLHPLNIDGGRHAHEPPFEEVWQRDLVMFGQLLQSCCRDHRLAVFHPEQGNGREPEELCRLLDADTGMFSGPAKLVPDLPVSFPIIHVSEITDYVIRRHKIRRSACSACLTNHYVMRNS